MRFRIAILATALLATPAFAATMTKPNYTTPPASEVSARDSNDGSWKFEIAPYLWALKMDGSVQVRGIRAPVNQSFSDILNKLNWAGMLWMQADKDKFGVFLNLIYASLSAGASDRYISAHANDNFGLYSAGLSYEVYKKCFCSGDCRPDVPAMSITPYLGARYTKNDLQLKVNTPFGNLRNSNDKSWTDPIIGARLRFDLTKAWLLNLSGDVGGTNTVSDYSYNLWGVLGYKPQTMLTSTTWYLGYRYLYQHYSSGSSSNYFLWNMKLAGPVVGVGFTF